MGESLTNRWSGPPESRTEASAQYERTESARADSGRPLNSMFMPPLARRHESRRCFRQAAIMALRYE
jgi:hypothetical protein